ncbi:MAG TPA: protein kinase [Gemmatimonadales bacterium]|jgi:serine/threonine-protein kinase
MPDVLDRLTTALADRYRVDREIGRGGMAHVFLAHDLKLDRPVALKVLRPELAVVLGGDRFLREITLAAKLEHPHILGIHDSGEANGLLYYVMPYVEGESLRDRLRREKQLPVDDALKISREVADALSYAHAHGVVHRDIKPENILLESGHAVVADFGIARAIDAAGGEKLTETGVTLGTPAYMSPEQAGGSRELDGRSDLYSLGCVLYEMLAGQAPFTGPTVESIVHQHLAVEPPNITAIRPAVPARVAATLQRALAKTPADRFNPVALFAEALGPLGPPPAAHAPPRRSKPRLALLGLGLVLLIAGAVGVGRWIRRGASGSAHPHTAIAVLPFQNLSAEGPHAYFAAGLHDELLTQLAKVAALAVMGRTSVMGYAGTTKPLPVIADELGVGSIVEGSVQVLGDRLRVNVQLLDAATGRHLWAERYDRTLDDAFAIQSEVAQQIVAAVGATLGGSEQAAIAEAPTANAEAYRLYLQGQEYFHRPGRLRRNLEIAQGLYEQAVALDSTFALAWAALSETHGRMWYWYDPSPTRLVREREAAQTALWFAPDLPKAHVAMGVSHYFGTADWRAALAEYRIALADLPNDADLWARIGYVHRRLGNWDGALAALDSAVALDPRNADALGDLGATYDAVGRYPEAVRWYGRSLSLAPDLARWDVMRGWTWVDWQGQFDSLEAALDRHGPEADLGPLGPLSAQWARMLLWQRQPDSLLGLLRQTPRTIFDGRSLFLPSALYAAWAHQLRRDGAAAPAAFASALVLLDSALAALPDDWRVHASRGLTLAGLARRREAHREARWLQESQIYRDDAYDGPRAAVQRAQILAGIGDPEPALDEMERLLAAPSGPSVYEFRLNPLWDSIRDHPRFQALLVKYANPKPVE